MEYAILPEAIKLCRTKQIKLDTQGMGAPMSEEDYAKWKAAGGKERI